MKQPKFAYLTNSFNQPAFDTCGYFGYWRFTYFAYFYDKGNSPERVLTANRTT